MYGFGAYESKKMRLPPICRRFHTLVALDFTVHQFLQSFRTATERLPRNRQTETRMSTPLLVTKIYTLWGMLKVV